MDEVFLGLAGLLLGISLEIRPWEIPRSSPASPRKTPSIPAMATLVSGANLKLTK